MRGEGQKAPRYDDAGRLVGYKSGPAPYHLNGCAVVGYLAESAEITADDIRVRGGEVFFRDNYIGRVLPGCLEVEGAVFSFFSFKALKRVCEVLEERG